MSGRQQASGEAGGRLGLDGPGEIMGRVGDAILGDDRRGVVGREGRQECGGERTREAGRGRRAAMITVVTCLVVGAWGVEVVSRDYRNEMNWRIMSDGLPTLFFCSFAMICNGHPRRETCETLVSSPVRGRPISFCLARLWATKTCVLGASLVE